VRKRGKKGSTARKKRAKFVGEESRSSEGHPLGGKKELVSRGCTLFRKGESVKGVESD